MRFVDFHAHVYPDHIAEKATRATCNFYGLDTDQVGTVADMLARGAAAGISRYVVHPVATHPTGVRHINEYTAGVVAAHAEIEGFGTIHPDMENVREELAFIRSLGLKGLKLHPDMQKFHIDHESAYPIYKLCVEHGLPILMHMGDPRFDYSHPDRLYRVMRDFPTLTVVGAHMGGWANWDYACDRLSDFPNLYVDTSSSMATPAKEYGIEPHVTSLSPAHTADLIRRWGAEKVVFGTDYPMWSQAEDLAVFFAMGLTEDENRMILSENARRVFRI